MTISDLILRTAVEADAAALTALYLRSRTAAMPWLVSPYNAAETLSWMQYVVVAEQRVWVAQRDARLLGFASVDREWLESLYVDPESQGAGVGRALLEVVKQASPNGLALHVFTRNARARRFYEAAGFTLVESGDGSGNEEREPDCTYRW